ncbi:MAG: 4Fe-4S dicluster domain-containing protein [Thermodesulfobacteriota bacterium]|nr:4Fe-4S dicluster domain-containing protein [Thermodesulfobacteriota bacterium]
MTTYSLPKDKLPDFLSALSDFEIWAPVKKDTSTLFEVIKDSANVSLDLQNQPVISKKAIFPQTELLFSYDMKEGITEPYIKGTGNTFIFGIRPCDARSFTLLDPVFEGDIPDPYYLSRRRTAVLAGIACTQPFLNCFCTSIGGNPFSTEGLDLLFIEFNESSFFIEVISDQGQKVIDKASSLFSSPSDEETKKVEQLKEEATNKIERQIDLTGVPDKLAGIFEHPVWKQFASKCIGCGICTYSCPTCYCFDMQDETTFKQGKRVRTWDSCMFPEYTLHASGHNPRETRTERFRNRIYHKFKFNVDNFKDYSCVGCGRCITLCPVNIDLLEYLSEIKETE